MVVVDAQGIEPWTPPRVKATSSLDFIVFFTVVAPFPGYSPVFPASSHLKQRDGAPRFVSQFETPRLPRLFPKALSTRRCLL